MHSLSAEARASGNPDVSGPGLAVGGLAAPRQAFWPNAVLDDNKGLCCQVHAARLHGWQQVVSLIHVTGLGDA